MDKRDDGIEQLLYNVRAEFTALKARCKGWALLSFEVRESWKLIA